MITFFWSERVEQGEQVRLSGDPAHHARARRVVPGEPARVLDGKGNLATGEISTIAHDAVTVSIARVVQLRKPVPLEVIVPVGDRDRMLMAAEKCAELQVTAWRPARFARSRSVSPRGEGEKFRQKVKARMESALEQSGGGWLPEIHPEREAAQVMASIPAAWPRILLVSSGTSFVAHISNAPMAIAIGPEGGFEPDEIDTATRNGWIPGSLGETILRFETAIIAAAAVVRATQSPASAHGN